MPKYPLALVCLTTLGWLSFIACTTAPTAIPSPSSEPPSPTQPVALNCIIKVASLLSLQGYAVPQSASMVNSMQLALDEHGATTKDGKCNIVFASLDDSTATSQIFDPQTEKVLANQLAADLQVLAVVGPYYARAAKLAIPIFNQGGGLVMVSPSPATTYWALTKNIIPEDELTAQFYPTGIRNFARVVPSDDTQGHVGARWYKAQGLHAVFLIHDDDTYGRGIAAGFDEEAQKLGLTIKENGRLDQLAEDYAMLVKKIAKSGADSVYLSISATERTPTLLKQLAASGWKGQVGGPDSLFDSLNLANAGSAAEGLFGTSREIPLDALVKSSPAAAKWFNAYKLRFGKPPEMYAPYAYEAMNVVLAALDQCSAAGTVTRECVRGATLATENWDGVLGEAWSFDENGDTSLTLEGGTRVKNGNVEFVEIVK